MKRALVVGINGVIGSALFAHLKSNGYDVCGTTQREVAPKASDIVYLNLLDDASWPKAQSYDAVYMCAGMCKMALCESDPALTRQVNVEATVGLLTHLADHGAHIVFPSTNQVFAGEVQHIAPDAPYQPNNEYGRQKAEAEKLLRQHIASLSIIRLAKVVEPRMQLIDNWINNLKQAKSIDAFNDMMLAPVSLDQVIKAFILLGKKKLSGIYQLSGDKDVSYYELAKHLAARLGVDETLVNEVSASEKGIQKNFLPRFTSMDCSSIMSQIKDTPMRFQDVLQEGFGIS